MIVISSKLFWKLDNSLPGQIASSSKALFQSASLKSLLSNKTYSTRALQALSKIHILCCKAANTCQMRNVKRLPVQFACSCIYTSWERVLVHRCLENL